MLLSKNVLTSLRSAIIQAVDVPSGSDLDNLDPGEQAAIVLAE
jgi:hypothetical protein